MKKTKKMKPAFAVLSSVAMALTLASPALADVQQPSPDSKVEKFKENANVKEEKAVLGTDGKKGEISPEKIEMQNNDWDNDGIPNDLETNGYKIEFNYQTGKNEARAWDPEKDKGKLKFITNPMSANSDGDPFSDAYEVQYFGSDSDTELNPMIANMPNLQIGIKRIGVTPIKEITDSKGGSINKGWEKSVSTQHSFNVGLTVGGGVEGSAAGPVPKADASLNVGYGYSKTNTETESYSNNFDWSTATTVDTAKAAKVSLQLEYKNTGTASAENVSPHFNIRLGDKIINTVKATQDRYKAQHLSTEKGGRNKTEVLIDSLDNQADVNIYLSLDELKAVEQGAPLSVEVLPTSTMDLAIEKDGEFTNLGDAGKYESRVNASTALLETDIGNKPKFRVYAPDGVGSGNLTFNEVFKHINVDSKKVNEFIDNGRGTREIVTKEYLENAKESGVSKGVRAGVFEKLQPPTLTYSAYDPIKKKLYAAVVPGIFGASNEIFASYEDKKSKTTKQVTLVKNGNVYESKENVSLDQFDPSKEVTFEINDSLKKLPTQKVSTVVKYNKEFDNLLVDNKGEFIVEGKEYYLKTTANIPNGVKEWWSVGNLHQQIDGQYVHFSVKGNNWDGLRLGPKKQAIHGTDIEATPVIIERKGQSKPGEPIGKGEEVFLKFTNSTHGGYEYLNAGNGYDYSWLDQERNKSTIKLDKISNEKSFYLKSDSTYITYRGNEWFSSVADNGIAPTVFGHEKVLKPEHTTSPGENHKWELESIK
ncbi:binary toxin-like calcium binding domain-containing protein [Bacillus cereus group sp. BfR-BA-01380]|uniref:binary toxin-like calcium binding domain-containing protein n=1 Tax=Bacillus cereus group sp. BfR-BA-01380 TaxID=2920324 RepID=UPI001F55BD55|nr:binary toxin-like calcium binding domain-containing protein [Bacillus cereus group sp. BfR-BA-01380]